MARDQGSTGEAGEVSAVAVMPSVGGAPSELKPIRVKLNPCLRCGKTMGFFQYGYCSAECQDESLNDSLVDRVLKSPRFHEWFDDHLRKRGL